MNIEPSAEDLAEIASAAAETARRFNVKPRVAMLSFSNFGSTRHPLADKVRRAVELVKQRAPDLIVDGEMQADTAVVPEIIQIDVPVQLAPGRRQRADLSRIWRRAISPTNCWRVWAARMPSGRF